MEACHRHRYRHRVRQDRARSPEFLPGNRWGDGIEEGEREPGERAGDAFRGECLAPSLLIYTRSPSVQESR